MPLTLSNSFVCARSTKDPKSLPSKEGGPSSLARCSDTLAANSQRTAGSPGLALQESSELAYAKPAFSTVKSLLALCHLAGSFMSADYS